MTVKCMIDALMQEIIQTHNGYLNS